MSAKKYDDTTLEYYGLTKEDIEEMRKWPFFSLEEIEKADKMQEILENFFDIKNINLDTEILLGLYNKIFSDVQSIIVKASRQEKKEITS